MKIVILTNNLNYKSGWGRYSVDLIEGLIRRGHEVSVLVEDDGCGGVKIIKRGKRLIESALRVRKYFKEAEIIHALDIYPHGIIAALGLIGINRPLLITTQGTYSIRPFYNWETRFLSMWACNKSSAIISISSFTKNFVSKFINSNKITTINHGIDVKKFIYSSVAKSNTIISVGAIKARKGYEDSIRAFALAKLKIGDLKYVIVGNKDDAMYFNRLSRLINELQVGESVVFMEKISDEELKNLYLSSKIFMLLSKNIDYHVEGFGLVFLEAAAMGLPVIGTTGNGIEDAVNNNHNGLLVSQSNPIAASEAIIKILSDQNLCGKMSENGLSWAQAHDIDSVVEKYEFEYKKVLSDYK
jgi:glycosyltransferase involved in cell wall biosynthesis